MGHIRIITQKILTAALISKIFSYYYADIHKFIWWLQKIFQVMFFNFLFKAGERCQRWSLK